MRSNVLSAQPSLWMLKNPIASSLLLLSIIVMGILSFDSIRQESYPSYKINEIIIEASYPGATPEDIEESILLPIEHSLTSNVNVERISSEASYGSAYVVIELSEGVSPNAVLTQVKNDIDVIQSFPVHMEKPTVKLAEEFDSIVEIGLYGDAAESTLYQHAN